MLHSSISPHAAAMSVSPAGSGSGFLGPGHAQIGSCAGTCVFVDARSGLAFTFMYSKNGYRLEWLKQLLEPYGCKLLSIGGVAPEKYPSRNGHLQVPDNGRRVIYEQIIIRKRELCSGRHAAWLS